MKTFITIRFFASVFFLFVATALFPERTFVHPGLSHKQSDLERMRAMVAAKINPWYNSFLSLSKESGAKYTYSVRGNSSITKVVQGGENYSAMSSDVRASYLNALMWAVTGDERHAQKAVEIFNAWQNLSHFETIATKSLDSGRMGWILIEAAEIIAHTYDGWQPADIQKFKNMLVHPGYSNTTVPDGTYTFYWNAYMGDSGRHGNQDLFGWRLVTAIGVFTDNEIMYDRAFRYVTNQKSRNDDLNYEPGPPITSPDCINTNDYYDEYRRLGQNNHTPDYGYNGVVNHYIWENGQGQESSRDQDHAVLGVGMIASIAEIAWNQGDDIYGMFDNRILKGYEWALRYNISFKYSFPDQSEPWEPSGYTEVADEATFENGLFIKRFDRSGRWFSKKPNPHYEKNFTDVSRGNFKGAKRPIYELAYAHYKIRLGLDDEAVKWTKRAMDITNNESGNEKSGWSLDHLGWGGLTCHRTEWMAGDPVSFKNGVKSFTLPKTPCLIDAVDYDFFTGDGKNRTYFDTTTGNSGNIYRKDDVDIIIQGDDGYVISDMANGEWLSYTVEIAAQGDYYVVIRHNTSDTGAKLKIVFENGVEIEKELNVTTGFEDTVLGIANLPKGVSVFRVYTTGESGLTMLKNIKISDNYTSSVPTFLNDLYTVDFIVRDNTVFFKDLPEDMVLSVHTTSGQLILIKKNGKSSITLPEKGIYLFTAESKTGINSFKIII